MTPDRLLPARVWSLTEDQEFKLKQMWAYLLKYQGYNLPLTNGDIESGGSFVTSRRPNDRSDDSDESTTVVSTRSGQNSRTLHVAFRQPEQDTKKAAEVVEWLHTIDVSEVPSPQASEHTRRVYHNILLGKPMDKGLESLAAPDADANHVEKALRKYYFLRGSKPDGEHRTSETARRMIQTTVFGALRNDGMDNLVLRFLRAQRFQLKESIDVIVNNLVWRGTTYPVDKWSNEGDASMFRDNTHPKLIHALKLNQAYIRGRDRMGCPIVIVRVKEHFRGDCSDQEFEQMICHVIEWTRLTLSEYEEGADSGSLLFDMTGFSLKNADLHVIQFLVQVMDHNYPEGLGIVWVHKAPRVFNLVWRVIKNWINPVVAAKIHFTQKYEDLETFIEPQYIPVLLGGKDDFVMLYVEPTSLNSGRKPEDAHYQSLMTERDEAFMSFIESTVRWILAKTPEESNLYLEHKIKLGLILAKNYIQLDPYIRDRGLFDRNGEIGALRY